MSYRVLSFVFLVASVAGILVNRTIDDQYGDEVTGLQVAYAPAAFWTQGNGCSGCAFHVNTSLAHNGTWHDSSYTPSRGDDPTTFSFSFNGTAVYVFIILVRLTTTDVNIMLDGAQVGNFSRFQDVSVLDQYVYNAPILALDSIPYGQHSVVVTSTGSNSSLLYFDYAVYTTNTSVSDIPPLQSDPSSSMTSASPSPSSNSPASSSPNPSSAPQPGNDVLGHYKSNVGAIVGGVVGGIGILAACLLAVLLYRKHRKLRFRQSEATTPTPFPTPGHSSTSSRFLPPEKASAAMYASGPSPTNLHSDYDRDTVSSDDAASLAPLRDQLLLFRTELAALRSRSSRVPVPQEPTNVPESVVIDQHIESSAAASPLANEVAQLRAEVSQLRIQHETNIDHLSPLQRLNAEEIQREINVMRSEIEELRMQQYGPLPAYSPPPDARARRLHVAPE